MLLSSTGKETIMATLTRRNFVQSALGAGAMLGLWGCSEGDAGTDTGADAGSEQGEDGVAASDTEGLVAPEGLAISAAAWSYDSDADVYYQIGVPYCTSPEAEDYESMGIYVPGAYFSATENGDGTYTCAIDEAGTVGGWTATTAPVVMPINTAGYSAQKAPASYSSNGLSDYLEAGLVYVYAGCRGRDITEAAGNAPWGVTDLKAAVRTLRCNTSVVPGNMDRIFSFGHSGGGAQSAVLGATGDAAGYEPYLEQIGAALTDANGAAVSDAIFGAMCWCPITNLDQADAAYEWNMGQFASSGTRAEGTFTEALSKDLAASYADYINELGLVDEAGASLSLSDGGEGIATAGSYYDHVIAVIEDSLNTFLANTEFPYTPSNSFSADMGAGGGGAPSGDGPSGDEGTPPDGGPSGDEGAPPDGGSSDDEGLSGTPGVSQESSSSDSTTYETATAYIAHLNESATWVEYSEGTNTALVTSLAGFVSACKSPTKAVGAFDDLDRGQAENAVFGNGAGVSLHFDTAMRDLLVANADAYAELESWDSGYPDAFASDIELTDALGSTSVERQNLYNPLFYLSEGYEGAGTSTPAEQWRIRTGITQGDTALTTEINLALAAAAAVGQDAVDFATVWGLGHTTAEITGDSTENFISWVEECSK